MPKFRRGYILILIMTCTLAGANAQGNLVTCQFLSAQITFGTLPPLATGTHDGVGEIRLNCQNLGRHTTEITIAAQILDGRLSHQSTAPHTLSSNDLGIQFYRDPARTQELAVGGGAGTFLDKRVNIPAGLPAEVVIPVYARIQLTSKTYAGAYSGNFPVLLSVP